MLDASYNLKESLSPSNFVSFCLIFVFIALQLCFTFGDFFVFLLFFCCFSLFFFHFLPFSSIFILFFFIFLHFSSIFFLFLYFSSIFFIFLCFSPFSFFFFGFIPFYTFYTFFSSLSILSISKKVISVFSFSFSLTYYQMYLTYTSRTSPLNVPILILPAGIFIIFDLILSH